MCGIFGWVNNIDIEVKNKLFKLNHKRGGYSAGLLWLNDYNKILDVDFTIKDEYLERDILFGQFRAPTGINNDFIYNENYPLIYDNEMYLFGNGIISADYYLKLKDEFNDNIYNDLYYIGKGIVEYGFDWLSNIDGVFALSLVYIKNKVLKDVILIRNTFPIFYNNNSYSSVNIGDMKLLENGYVYSLLNNKIITKFKPKENPYLI